MEIVLYDSRSARAEPICAEVPIISASHVSATPLVRVAPPPGRLLHYLGYNLMALAFGGLIFIGSPILVPKIQSKIAPRAAIEPVTQVSFKNTLDEEAIEAKQNSLKLLVEEEAKKYGVDTDFSVVIPKISATAKVVPNVNPSNEQEYVKSLKEGVAHAAGTKFPGEGGTIFLFAHSTNTLANVLRYNAIFYQLKDLEPSDKIIIFYQGQRFIYQVLDRQIVKAKDTSWLANDGEEKLILQTCWPPGTSLERLIVIAKPV